MARVLRDLKKGELTLKDMSVLREADSTKVQHSKASGGLTDYSLQHVVTMGWQPDKKERALLPFRLTIDHQKFMLSWAELRDLDRIGFFRRETDYHFYRLKIYDGPKITLNTNLNDEAQRDMIFRLSTKDQEVYLDWYQFSRYGRWI